MTASADDYTRQVHISVPPERVFAALTTASEFAPWWAPAVGPAAEGGGLRVTFAGFDDPLVLRVKQAARPSVVSWDVEDGGPLPEWLGTTVTFTLSESGTGGCDVRFRHHGLTPQLKCYDVCRASWDQYLPSLRDYIESGTGNPYRGPR